MGRVNVPLSYSCVKTYVRLATYKERVLASGATRIREAMNLLRGLPDAMPRNPRSRTQRTPWEAIEVKKLVASGMNYADAGEAIGVSRSKAWELANPSRAKDNQRKSERKRIAARKALQEAERELDRKRIAAAAKQHGGDISVAHSHVRNLLSYLDKSLAQLPREQHPEIRSAIAAAHKAEDFILAAMKIERQSA